MHTLPPGSVHLNTTRWKFGRLLSCLLALTQHNTPCLAVHYMLLLV